MLALTPRSLSSPSFPLFSSLKLKPHLLPFKSKPFTHLPTIKMSTPTSQIIEHFVLFKVKPDTHPSKISLMINNLNSLTSLNQVHHLTAGPIHNTHSPFTHLLHSRYKTKEDLYSYSAHPDHVRVVQEFIKPIIDDIMAVDWVSDLETHVGSAMRVMFFKLRDEEHKDEIFKLLAGLKDKFEVVDGVSFGENFSPERAKGFGIGSLVAVKGLEGLDLELEKEKVGGLIESVLVLDYAVPQLASL